jgi:hypothetical protein
MLGTLLVTHVTIASKSSQPARQNHAKPTKQALEIGNGFCLEMFGAWQKCPSLNCHGSCGDRGKAAESLGVFGQSWGSQSCSALDEILHISRSKLFQNSMLQISF